MTATICGTGSYIPSYTMDNNDIARLVETSDEWIRERTGVARRHIAKDETTVSMAAEAAGRALADAGIPPEEVDLILVSTISSDVILPCAACEVQKEIGALHATCFDLSAACTGFVLAYNTALAYLSQNLTNWKDRGSCILFGDGAGAAVLRAVDPEKRAYLPVTHSDGSKGAALSCKSRHDHNGLIREIRPEAMLDESHYMQMDGQAVFKFAVKRVPEVIGEVLKLNRLDTDEIAYYILHQANKRIVEAVAKRLNEPMEKFPMNLQEYGNTSSASIPILLDEMNREGRLAAGQKLVLAGFGAGLTWGAAVIEWR